MKAKVAKHLDTFGKVMAMRTAQVTTSLTYQYLTYRREAVAAGIVLISSQDQARGAVDNRKYRCSNTVKSSNPLSPPPQDSFSSPG